MDTPPDFGPCYMPYHLLGPAFVALIDPTCAWNAPGLVDLVDLLVAYFTVYVHLGLPGMSDGSKRNLDRKGKVQLRELWGRVKAEERRLRPFCDADVVRRYKHNPEQHWAQAFKPVSTCVGRAGVFHEELEALWGRQWF